MLNVNVFHCAAYRFKAVNDDGFEILMDAAKEYGGDAGMTPMETVLAALGACSGMDIVTILGNRGQELTCYEVHVSAEQAEEYPKVFTRISVEHVVKGRNLSTEIVKHAVDMSTSKYCSVLAMLKETAVADVTWRIEPE